MDRMGDRPIFSLVFMMIIKRPNLILMVLTENVTCKQTLNCEDNSIDDSLRFRECGVVLTRRWDVIRTGLLWPVST